MVDDSDHSNARKTALCCLASFGGVALCAWGYAFRSTPGFYAGALLLAAALGPLSFRAGQRIWPPVLLRTTSTIFLIVLLFLALELGWAALSHFTMDDSWKQRSSYSYDEARADPDGFRRWWNRHLERFRGSSYLTEDTEGKQPFILAPGARSKMFESEVRINELGFRGPEIELASRDHYRIVALGESTTFGATAYAGDRPWPELLESMIAERLECRRPVQIVNAGVPGWTLANQLARLRADVLPLGPDLLLSYHGYNGFHYFFPKLPEMLSASAPDPRPRPTRVIGRVEYALRIWDFRRRFRQAGALEEASLEQSLRESAYADLYRKLQAFAKRNDIGLALCTFSMAVNEASPEEAIRFYEETFPDVRGRMRANRLHNHLVRDLGTRRGVPAIDTSVALDGRYREYFTDVIHLNQQGRELLAQTIFEGLIPVLESESELRCRPRLDSGD